MLARQLRRNYLCWKVGGAALLALVAMSCEKTPLLAPSGSTITLSSSTSVLSANGSATIIAQVLEAAGTPPHSGTQVTFTTTLGRVEPPSVSTDSSGRAAVTFLAASSNGTATISATSGGASTGATGMLTIVVGSAAVGRVSLSANPSVIASNGGTSVITANVLDINGSPLGLVPVTFSTSAGSLSTGVVNSDAGGLAQTTLTTSVQATVTATVGVASSGSTGTGSGGGTNGGSGGGTTTGGSVTGQASASVTVNVNPVPTVSITPPAGTLTARSPIVFTINISPGTNSTAQIRDVKVDFGDGDSIDLGAATGTTLSVSHVYDDADTYSVRVTAVDTLGGTTSAATVIVVLPEPPLAVTIASAKVTSGTTTTVTFTATVTPATATVVSYVWDFGDGNQQSTTSNQAVKNYTAGSPTKIVTVTVTTTTGQTATGQTAVAP